MLSHLVDEFLVKINGGAVAFRAVPLLNHLVKDLIECFRVGEPPLSIANELVLYGLQPLLHVASAFTHKLLDYLDFAFLAKLRHNPLLLLNLNKRLVILCGVIGPLELGTLRTGRLKAHALLTDGWALPPGDLLACLKLVPIEGKDWLMLSTRHAFLV